MSSIFVDTSALFAYLVENDHDHPRAKRIGTTLFSEDHLLVTHSFIVCEIVSLLQHRVGLDAVRQWDAILLPLLDITWVDSTLYRQAATNLLETARRQVSLVDHISFELMRQHGITTAFAFDPHFQEFGFRVL